MQGLNFKKFKKTKEDEQTATLLHPEGHSITIAKKALDPALKEQLESLPLHAKKEDEELHRMRQENNDRHEAFMKNHEEMMKPKKMSEGGEASDEEAPAAPAPDAADPTSAPAHGVNININATPQAPQPMAQMAPQPSMQIPHAPPQAAQPSPQEQAPAPTPERGLASVAPAPAAPPSPEEVPGQAGLQTTDFKVPAEMQSELQAPSPVQSLKQTWAQHKAANQDDLVQEDQKFADDLANGHIQPKTYKDLFAEKSTLGKVGTLFGMLVGGAGSGLAHQQNLLMSAMDKQIQNDMQAQIESKHNAQNFLRLNQADLANKVNALGGVENVKTAAQARTMAQMYQSTYHDLLQNVDKMPPAQQAKYRQALMVLYPKLVDKINNLNDLASSAMATQGINPFSAQKTQTPQTPQVAPKKPGSAKNLSPSQRVDDELKASRDQQTLADHFLSKGASDAITNAVTYNPRFQGQKGEILEQAKAAALSDKAMDAINEAIPQLSTLTNGDNGNGYLRRQAHNLAGVHYIGPMVEGLSRLMTDTNSTRDYDSLYQRVSGAVRGALKGQMGADELDTLISRNAPETGDNQHTFETKLNTLKSYVRDHTATNLLENIPGVRNKSKAPK